jgi:hypothetical protein
LSRRPFCWVIADALMKLGWIEVLLLILATVVVTLVAVWAWTEFKTWRINREYGPANRRGKVPGRRKGD